MLSATRRTTIQIRDFICKGDAHHHFALMVRLTVDRSGSALEHSAEFKLSALAKAPWVRIPLCPVCGEIAEERATYNPSAATVPSSERFVAWLSPDGQRLSVPGRADATMPDRYRVAGYRPVEAHSMRDFDRLSAIRESQTGNEVISEMNFDPESRNWHDEAEYDPDDMTSFI